MSAFKWSDRIGQVGLRSRVFILVLLAVAPLLGLLVSGAIADRKQALANARARALELAHLGAERQADMLQQARHLLTVLRRMPEILNDEPEICRATVKMVAADHPQFNTIGVVDQHGINRCHTIVTNRRPFTDVALFRQAMAPDAPPFIVGQFRIGAVSGKPVVIMASPLPKAADGTPRGMVFASLNLDLFQRVSAEFGGTHRQVVLVIDPRTGTVLARAPDSQDMIGRIFAAHPLVRAMAASPDGGVVDAPGLADDPELAGVSRLYGFARLPAGGGVMIAVGLSRHDILVDANTRLLVALSVAVVALMGALMAAWVLGHLSQFQPIRDLVGTARRLGRGELAARTALEDWQAPEFRLLGSTLNDMASSIALAQKNLHDSEVELRLLADNSIDMIFKLDLDFRQTYVSPSSREILGYEPHELIGKLSYSMVHPDDAGRVVGSYQGLMTGLEHSTTISRIQRRDGRWIWIEAHKRALLNPDTGAPIGIIGSIRDISARRAAEDAVRASEALLRGVFDHTPNGILVNSIAADGSFVIESCNPAAAEIIGFPVGAVDGKPLLDVLAPAVVAKVKAGMDRCMATGEILVFKDSTISGDRQRSWDVTLTPIFGREQRVVRIIVTASETTEKKLAADMIRESRERYRLIADNVADLVVRLDRDLFCGFVSPASRELLGHEPEDLVARPLVEIVHPDDRDVFLEDVARLQATGSIDQFRFRVRHAGDSHIWVEATGRKLAESGGLILAIRDISRRKQIEDELARANDRLRALASEDGLTGLANRRSFDEVFDTEWQRAVRNAAPLGLIMLDVDRFKIFNDVYGHQAGDEGLRAVARAIKAALRRPVDFAARYGGEEFVVVLPGTDEAGTIEVAERIRKSVAESGLLHSGNAGGVVTISAGIWAASTAPPATARDALKCADANLYAAKAAGRNRVVHGDAPRQESDDALAAATGT